MRSRRAVPTAAAASSVGLLVSITASSSSAFQYSTAHKPRRRCGGGGGGWHPAPNAAIGIAAPAPRRRLGPLAVAASGTGTAAAAGTIDIRENAHRDVVAMEGWARNCGAQTSDGFRLATSDGGMDWYAYTEVDLLAGSPVLFVPSQMILSSSEAEDEFGGYLEASETALAQYEGGDGGTDRLPLFRLMVKILAEYELGGQSQYFPWLNGCPRWFTNGVAMTEACFDCLPPYAAWLSMKERSTFSKFLNALRKGYAPLAEETINDDDLIKWAYNVALTRHHVVVAGREKKITPLADMFNHGTFPNVQVSYDARGNCVAAAARDVPAGSPLTVSLGDPTNPTPLFATYGFLSYDCSSIFCKAVHLEGEIISLGYGYEELLFSTETGEMMPKVWDVFLLRLLLGADDPNLAQGFSQACRSNDDDTKQAYHQQYFPYTLEAMKEHVNGILRDVELLNAKADSYDLSTHPRVPFIMTHNDLVKSTFLKVKAKLDAMG